MFSWCFAQSRDEPLISIQRVVSFYTVLRIFFNYFYYDSLSDFLDFNGKHRIIFSDIKTYLKKDGLQQYCLIYMVLRH